MILKAKYICYYTIFFIKEFVVGYTKKTIFNIMVLKK